MLSITAAAVAALLSRPTLALAADEWASFQNGGRCVLAERDLPLKWSPGEGIAWSVELEGSGQSSPIIWKDRVYVTFAAGDLKDTVHVRALRLDSGAPLWEHEEANRTPEKDSGYVSRAAPTPVADANGVIAFFEGGNLVALKHDGGVRWQLDLVKEHGAIAARHGLAASLEEDEESVFVWVERTDEPYVLRIAKETGKTLWKADGVGKTSWGSPRLVPLAGGSRHLVLSASGRIVGLDPGSGERLWQLEDVANNTTATPIPLGEGRFIIGAGEGRGEQSSGGPSSNGVVQISKGEGGEFAAAFLWRAAKASSSFASPIVAGGNAYFVNRVGVLYCADAKNGAVRWAERAGGSVWATPLAAGGRLYLFGRDGTTTVLLVGEAFEVLARNVLFENGGATEGEAATTPPAEALPAPGATVLYAAAVAGERIILRTGDRVYCVAE